MTTQFTKKIGKALLKKLPVVNCDDDSRSLVQQADAAIESHKAKIKVPMQYENVKNVVSQGSVNTFDGCRVSVQKQLNLDTVVSHFYWFGSQQAPPVYQYRLILPFDGKLVNIATDLDANIDGEFSFPLQDHLSGKIKVQNGDEKQSLGLSLDITDGESCAGQLSVSRSGNYTVGASLMQSVNPYLSLGGMGEVEIGKNSFHYGLAAVFDDGKTAVSAQFEGNQLKASYVNRVNPGRVQLISDLTIDTSNSTSNMSCGGEFQMKQSKVHMSVDSNLTIRTTLETSISPGVQLTLAAESAQLSDAHKFGISVHMG